MHYGKPKQDAQLIHSDITFFDSSWKRLNLPKPPDNNSNETKEELNQILNYRKSNTIQDKKKIKEQDIGDIERLFIDFLRKKEEKIDNSLIRKITKVSEELSTISLHFKIEFDRPRPFQFLKALGEDPGDIGKTTGSPSYPSTHALIGTFMAMWLSRLYPKYKTELNKLGKELGDYRVKAGFHFQSDCDSGNWLAKELFKLKKDIF